MHLLTFMVLASFAIMPMSEAKAYGLSRRALDQHRRGHWPSELTADVPTHAMMNVVPGHPSVMHPAKKNALQPLVNQIPMHGLLNQPQPHPLMSPHHLKHAISSLASNILAHQTMLSSINNAAALPPVFPHHPMIPPHPAALHQMHALQTGPAHSAAILPALPHHQVIPPHPTAVHKIQALQKGLLMPVPAPSLQSYQVKLSHPLQHMVRTSSLEPVLPSQLITRPGQWQHPIISHKSHVMGGSRPRRLLQLPADVTPQGIFPARQRPSSLIQHPLSDNAAATTEKPKAGGIVSPSTEAYEYDEVTTTKIDTNDTLEVVGTTDFEASSKTEVPEAVNHPEPYPTSKDPVEASLTTQAENIANEVAKANEVTAITEVPDEDQQIEKTTSDPLIAELEEDDIEASHLKFEPNSDEGAATSQPSELYKRCMLMGTCFLWFCVFLPVVLYVTERWCPCSPDEK